MATRRATVFPFKTEDFTSTFLDPSKISRGYDGELLDLDKNMAKSLLHPFPLIPSSFHYGLGSRMHSFVEDHLGLRREHCANVGQELKAVHREETHNEYQGRGQAIEKKNLPKDPGNINIDIAKASDVVSFSDDDLKTQADQESGNECTTDEMPLEEEVMENNTPTERSDEEDTIKPQRNTSTQAEHTLALSLFKKAIKQDASMELSDLTVKLNLQALTSVLEHQNKKYRPSVDELNVCGNVALLYGSYTADSTVTVNSSDVKGVYNYIDGTVKSSLHSESETSNWVDLTLFLTLEMDKTRPTLGCETGLEKDIAVAWCISAPGLGIDLDWQVQEKLGKLINNQCSNKSEHTLAWCSVLVVVDEYRCIEKNLPLLEVYQLNSSAVVKVVNFDFQ